MRTTKIVILGGGEVASGVALRLHRCGYPLLLTETREPRAVRRLVAFSEAVYDGVATVEEAHAVRVLSLAEAERAGARGDIPVLVDPDGLLWPGWKPDILVDGRMLKGNHGLSRGSGPVVIGLGPGFTAGSDCLFAVETMRGHDLGRVLDLGPTRRDTGTPGVLGGESARRVLRSPHGGTFLSTKRLGDLLHEGDEVGRIDERLVLAPITGRLRGLLRPGIRVAAGEKLGDVDPRDGIDSRRVSDRARAIAGGVLEAVLRGELSWEDET